MSSGNQLYIGNLDDRVTEAILYELFVQVSKVKAVRLPKDKVSKQHQGFAFVQFHSQTSAKYAMDAMRGVLMFEKPLKISEASSSLGGGNSNEDQRLNQQFDFGPVVFIGNLDPLTDNMTLQSTFETFGDIRGQMKIIRGGDTCHAFVTFQTFESADKAIKGMNGRLLLNRALRVDFAYKEGTTERHGDAVERQLWELRGEHIIEEEEEEEAEEEVKPVPEPEPTPVVNPRGGYQTRGGEFSRGGRGNFGNRGGPWNRGGNLGGGRGGSRNGGNNSYNSYHPYGGFRGNRGRGRPSSSYYESQQQRR